MEEFTPNPLDPQEERRKQFSGIFKNDTHAPNFQKTEDHSVDFAYDREEGDWSLGGDEVLPEVDFVVPPPSKPMSPLAMQPEMGDFSASIPRSKKKFWTVFAIIFSLFIFYNALAVIWVGTGVMDGKSALERAEGAAGELQINSALTELEVAKSAFVRARRGGKMLSWMRPIPWVGKQVKAMNLILDAGSKVLIVVEDAADLGSELFTVVEQAGVVDSQGNLHEESSFESISPDIKKHVLEKLHQSTSDLHKMRTKIHLAQADLDELEDLDAHPIFMQSVRPLTDIMPTLVAGIDFVTPFAASVGELAGVGADRQWLILFLNNTELRPGGGFIGVYGLMLTRDGELVNLQVDDSYNVDLLVEGTEGWDIDPPKPFTEFFNLQNWYFRDSNWSPDFADSAQMSTTMFRSEFASGGQPVPEVHGVIGFTPNLAEDLLEIIGPVTVDGITFTSENITEELEYQVEFAYAEEGIDKYERKDIVSDLADVVIDRIMHLPIPAWGEILQMLDQNFIEKQIAFYSFDEDTQQSFEDFGWSGALNIEDADDVLMVVDANVASLKTDPVIDRFIDYAIKKEGDDYIATTTVVYDHVGEYTPITGYYRSFTRVYAPLGSELLSFSSNIYGMEVVEELGMTSIGGYIEVAPGNQTTLRYTYKLPEETVKAIRRGVYELAVFKQMGAKNHTLTLDLNFGKNVRAAAPAEDEQFWGDDSYHLNTILDQDTIFTVEL